MVSKRNSLKLMARYSRSFSVKTRTLTARIGPLLERAIPWWALAWTLLTILKIGSSPSPGSHLGDHVATMLAYALIALAPLVALRLAETAYGDKGDQLTTSPRRSFARLGRWRAIAPDAARRHRLFGPVGIMASLLVGMLFNIVARSGEFMLAVPAIGLGAPDWARALFFAMALETMAMNFLYMVCFVMALRAVPAFPRMLAATWMIDIAFQLRTASIVGSQHALPPEVALALTGLLQGNVTKVCISIFIWLPYLLLSKRVNITYRHRLAA